MPKLDRRSLLFAFGVATVTRFVTAQSPNVRRVATAKPNENRFQYQRFDLHLTPACKVTSQDSNGVISFMELTAPPKSGPPLHVHHREDETYYALSGEFLFEVGGEKYSIPQGATIFAPRDIPHRWANTSSSDAKLILVCTPGGFERFFDEAAKAILDKAPMEQMGQIMTKYGCDPLGPPLFPPN
jgi:quercetin 2,3-dioxygenase